ncbi:H/ACA ribonucleoprotein complex subunit GAR1 [Vairimorpha necatrix]|uniref:H/ACA ribonucleoprotein complex subunit n=1 Tax=Vairimorpha necatrix TaxID=6039 RepID=A0AAX4J9X6_9MICR
MNRRNFKDRKQFDQSATLLKLGTFTHKCGPLSVLKLDTTDIPFPNAFVFDKNKKQIGKVDEIFGPQNDVFVAINVDKDNEEYYIYSNKLIPKSRFLIRSETEKKKEQDDKKKKARKEEGSKKGDNNKRDGGFRGRDNKGRDNRGRDNRDGGFRGRDNRDGGFRGGDNKGRDNRDGGFRKFNKKR